MNKTVAYIIIALVFGLGGCASAPPDKAGPPRPEPAPRDNIGALASPIKNTDILSQSPLLMQDVINLVLEDNPSLQSAQERWVAAANRPRQARALEDPMISVSAMNGMGAAKTGGMISQKIPLFGKRGLKGRVAEAESGMAEQASINARWRLIAQTKMAYYELFWFDQALRINKEVKDIIANLEQIAQLQYATGKASQQDVLKAQIELAKINNEIITLEQMKATAVTELNGLLNRPATAPLGEPAMLVLKPLKLSLEQLTEQAIQYSPELKMAQLEIDKDRNMLSLSRRQYYPDLIFSVEYNRITNGSSDNEWGGGVGLNIPIWTGKYNAAVREAEANQRAGEKNYQSMHNMIMVDIKNGYIKIQAAWRVMESYEKNLIPQAEQSLAASRMAYQTGKADFLNLLDSVRMLLDLKLGLYRAQVDYKKSLAELELCCAFPVESAVGSEEGTK